MYGLMQELRAQDQAAGCYAFGEYAHLSLHTDTWNEEDILHFLKKNNHQNIEVFPTKPTIEDCFIDYIRA
jgi:hypothetical protein